MMSDELAEVNLYVFAMLGSESEPRHQENDGGSRQIDIHHFLELKKTNGFALLAGNSQMVVDYLMQSLNAPTVSLDDIAAHFHCTPRTLQKKLQGEGVRFSQLRDYVRFHSAIDCLLEREMTVEETTYYLGFTDRSSFTHAFKRWTNLSPSTFKKLYRDYL